MRVLPRALEHVERVSECNSPAQHDIDIAEDGVRCHQVGLVYLGTACMYDTCCVYCMLLHNIPRTTVIRGSRTLPYTEEGDSHHKEDHGTSATTLALYDYQPNLTGCLCHVHEATTSVKAA